MNQPAAHYNGMDNFVVYLGDKRYELTYTEAAVLFTDLKNAIEFGDAQAKILDRIF